MKLVKGNVLDWNQVRHLLGLASAEIAVPSSIVEMEAMTLDTDWQFRGDDIGTDWPMVSLEAADEKTHVIAASVAAMVDRHGAFDHVPAGVWNHPLSMTDQSVGQLLVALGFHPNANQQVNGVGRVLNWM
jgi:hypothetical protein